jgi:hypothetical protein
MSNELVKMPAASVPATNNVASLPELVERTGGGRHALPGMNVSMPSTTPRTRRKLTYGRCGCP